MPDKLPDHKEGEPIRVDRRLIGFTLFAGEDTKSDPRQMASNPWAVISQHIARTEREKREHIADVNNESRSTASVQNAEKYLAGVKDARSYLHQAADLFRASQHARSATRPLLLYYSFMNLAVLLWMCRNEMEPPGPMVHGVSERGDDRLTQPFDMEKEVVKVHVDSSKRRSVVLRLAEAIGAPLIISGDHHEISLRQLLGQVPAVHRHYLQYEVDPQHIFRAIRSGFYYAQNGTGKGGEAWVALAVEDLDPGARERLAKTDHPFGGRFSMCECGPSALSPLRIRIIVPLVFDVSENKEVSRCRKSISFD